VSDCALIRFKIGPERYAVLKAIWSDQQTSIRRQTRATAFQALYRVRPPADHSRGKDPARGGGWAVLETGTSILPTESPRIVVSDILVTWERRSSEFHRLTVSLSQQTSS
jgi:hypothetical protein